MSDETDDVLSVEPEYQVVVSCLRQAIEDAVRKPSRRANADKMTRLARERIEAVDWLISDSKAPWSARWCADLAGLDIDEIRRRVLNNSDSVYQQLRYRRSKPAA
jgi:hypothetical protein